MQFQFPHGSAGNSTSNMNGNQGNVSNVQLPGNAAIRRRQQLDPASRQRMLVRVRRVDPLEPEPAHDPVPTSADGDNWDRFKCTICCEFMQDPSGCGKCVGRFCHSCLLRHVSNPSSSNTKAKCPICRVEMDSGVVRDAGLKVEISSSPSIQCCFGGCAEMIELPMVADHENKCPYAIVKCRYARFGCKWKGKRGCIASHEANDCNLAKVSGLVEQFRKHRIESANGFEVLRQQGAAMATENAVLRQELHTQLHQRESKSNIFALLEYCHLLTCATRHFVHNTHKWAPFFRNDEGQASVANFLVFLPLSVLFSATGLSGLRNLVQISKGFNSEVAEDRYLLADAILCMCIGGLGALMLAANFVDASSSRNWRRYKISKLMGSPPLICDILSLSSFTILVSLYEVKDAGIAKSILLWLLVTFPTTFFPVLVLVLSKQSALLGLGSNFSDQVPSPTQMQSQARSFEPILFGLRYSLVTHIFGAVPCLDAAVLINLLPRGPKTEHFLMRNSFFEGLPKSTYVAYFGAQLAILMGSNHGRLDGIEGFVTGSALAFACLLSINWFDYQMFILATDLGKRIFLRAQRVERDYSLLGMTSFGAWVCSLAILSQF